MKLLLFKFLLQRPRDEGFTLPIVFAIGLIMVLLGVLSILTASEENLNAASDNQKNRALAIAEVGVARYRELLDKNRILTVYNNTNWAAVTNTCDINSTITSFANETQWQTVNNGNKNIGQYRIVSYIYDIDGNLTDNDDGLFAPNDDNFNTTDLLTFNDNQNYNPRGVLKIQSKANDGSEAQVQVEIPIRINQEDMTNLYPALWIGSSNATDLGNIILGADSDLNENKENDDLADDTDNPPYDGRIVLSKPATGSTPGCDDPADLAGNSVITDPRLLPSIISLPRDNAGNIDTSVINTVDNPTNLSADARYNIATNELLLGKPSDTIWGTLEWDNGAEKSTWKSKSKGDNDGDKKIPHYFFQTTSNLTVDNQSLISDGSARVILYVDGDITLKNQAILDAGGAYASSMLLEIYGTSNTKNITFQPNGKTINVTALIHAPDATVQINGTGNVNIRGAMWVKNWDDNSGGNVQVRIAPDSAGFGQRQAYDYYFGTDNRAAKPITNAPTNWQVEEVE